MIHVQLLIQNQYHQVCIGQVKQYPVLLIHNITNRVQTACPGDIVHTYSCNTQIITIILYTQQVFLSSEEY